MRTLKPALLLDIMALTRQEISERFYRKRKDNGLCPRCGRKLDREGHYCMECLNKYKEYRKEDREFYKRNGICPVCRKEKLFGDEKQCIECREKSYQMRKPLTEEQKIKQNEHFREQQKRLYAERTKNGICTRCGKRKAEYGKKKCKMCLDKDAEIHRKKFLGRQNIKEYRLENNLCYFCGEPAEEDKNVCSKCSEERRKDRMKAKVNNSHWKSDNRLIFKN